MTEPDFGADEIDAVEKRKPRPKKAETVPMELRRAIAAEEVEPDGFVEWRLEQVERTRFMVYTFVLAAKLRTDLKVKIKKNNSKLKSEAWKHGRVVPPLEPVPANSTLLIQMTSAYRLIHRDWLPNRNEYKLVGRFWREDAQIEAAKDPAIASQAAMVAAMGDDAIAKWVAASYREVRAQFRSLKVPADFKRRITKILDSEGRYVAGWVRK